MTDWSVRRINHLAKLIGASRYLEIGVATGGTFLEVRCARKVGVDPLFQFDYRKHQSEDVILVQTESDAFFSGSDHSFDLIFLDGLHVFEQTYRDFVNALGCLSAGGVIIIDDVVPSDVYSSLKSAGIAVAERRRAGINGTAWHGDVFKILFALHDYHFHLDWRVVVTGGNAQAIVWRGVREKGALLTRTFEELSRLTYFDIFVHEAALNFRTEEQGLKDVERALSERRSRT